MDRIEGATEAAAFVRKVDFKPSTFKFDDAISTSRRIHTWLLSFVTAWSAAA